jgi:hypothetical protein
MKTGSTQEEREMTLFVFLFTTRIILQEQEEVQPILDSQLHDKGIFSHKGNKI